jgi:HSP20 family protein
MTALDRIKERLSFLTKDPICDIEETKSHSLISFDLPNMKPEDFDISVNGKTLLIAVRRHHVCPSPSESTKILQCHHHNFTREFNFPILLNPKTIEANYHNGILALRIPKNALLQKLSIPVKAGPQLAESNTKTSETTDTIEAFSDIDDYDWE